MIENATNLIAQSEGTAIGYIINWLIAFFSKSYAGGVLLAILIWVTIVLFYSRTVIDRKSKHVERIQQEYAKLLKPGAVKLEYDGNDELKYSNQNNLDFDDFIEEVKRQRKYRKFKVEDLYKKAEEAVKMYRKSVKRVYEGIKTISINVFKKEGFSSIIWNGEGNTPLGDYIDLERIPYSIEYIIKNRHPPNIVKPRGGGDGRYMLQCSDIMAKTTSIDKAEKIKELIENVARDYEVKKRIAKRDGAEKEIDEALKDYNDKIVKVIYNLRMYPSRCFF